MSYLNGLFPAFMVLVADDGKKENKYGGLGNRVVEVLEMTSLKLDDLPVEILENILSFPFITEKDLCKVSLVCIKFKETCNSNELWRKKFQQKWPDLKRLYLKGLTYDWKNEFMQCYICGEIMYRKVSQMSSQFYKQDEMSHETFAHFETITDHPLAYYFSIQELERILHSGDKNEYLTDKYYAMRVLRHLKHQHLKEEWMKFLSLPENQQLLETGAVLLAQWCQPSEPISSDEIAAELTNLAKDVQDYIRVNHPKHPVVNHIIKNPETALTQSIWSTDECQTVLLSMNEIMFQRHKFVGNRDDYYNASNSYINEVLQHKRGIPITLCLVYGAIAHRLGVQCLPVNCPGHFLLKWLSHPHLPSPHNYTFIDVFGEGKFMGTESCHNSVPGHPNTGPSKCKPPATKPVQVFHRMCWNLVEVGRQRERIGDGIMFLQNILELLSLLNPDGVEHKLLLARVYLHLNVNLKDVIVILQEIEQRDPASQGIVNYMQRAARSQLASLDAKMKIPMIVPKYRHKSPNVEYAVGMIMTHKKYNYSCLIFGWDPVCAASRDWIFQMGVYNLPNKDKQPFYNVLAEDGSNRYAAQENLAFATDPKPLTHSEVGKFFQHYKGTHYVPNIEKAMEYPEDGETRDNIVRRIYPDLCSSTPSEERS